MASAAARERYARKNEAEDLTRAFNALDRKGDGKLDAEELQALFNVLGHKPKRGEVEDLIWEVDEDCDGCISWQEFQRLYHRCRQDSTGEADTSLSAIASETF
jgi:calmodulin